MYEVCLKITSAGRAQQLTYCSRGARGHFGEVTRATLEVGGTAPILLPPVGTLSQCCARFPGAVEGVSLEAVDGIGQLLWSFPLAHDGDIVAEVREEFRALLEEVRDPSLPALCARIIDVICISHGASLAMCLNDDQSKWDVKSSEMEWFKTACESRGQLVFDSERFTPFSMLYAQLPPNTTGHAQRYLVGGDRLHVFVGGNGVMRVSKPATVTIDADGADPRVLASAWSNRENSCEIEIDVQEDENEWHVVSVPPLQSYQVISGDRGLRYFFMGVAHESAFSRGCAVTLTNEQVRECFGATNAEA